ncbi:MAG: hypothetical protein ABSH16_00090 [Sedimentisphaerales bacterium]
MTKRKPKRHLPPLKWAHIHALYESGSFASLPALHKNLTETMKNPPSFKAIRNHAHKEHWDKKLVKDKAIKMAEAAAADLYEKAGFGKEVRIKAEAELFKLHQARITAAIQREMEAVADNNPGKIKLAREETNRVLNDSTYAMNTLIRDAKKTTGDYTAQKVKLSGGVSFTDLPTTDEEINEELNRLRVEQNGKHSSRK